MKKGYFLFEIQLQVMSQYRFFSKGNTINRVFHRAEPFYGKIRNGAFQSFGCLLRMFIRLTI